MQEESSQPPATQPPVSYLPPPRKRSKKILVVTILTVLVIIAAATYWLLRPAKSTAPAAKGTVTSNTASQKLEGLQLDPNKNYGDKYANGILPVGDNQYSTTTAEKGKIYMCRANFVPANQAGAQSRGPWFIGTTQWDRNKKAAVSGNVNWQQKMSSSVNGTTRIITTNNLPDHPTGVFPVSPTDPAYKYDRNPNTISGQSLTYSLNSKPTYGTPQCMDGEVGVMLTGVALFNGFDAGGRDAGAWEVQDSCQGHPQGDSEYHYHTLSSCIKDVSVKTVIGFALDGYPITGPKVGDKNFLTTSDLDECHGITSELTLDNKKTTTYHYVMTEDFPYSASCFRSTAAKPPHDPNARQQNTQAPPARQP